MSRPYQHLRRAEIAELLNQNDTERERLKSFAARQSAEADAVRGNDLESIKRRMPLMQQSIEATTRVSALLDEVQAMNFELHIRDTPSLVAEFGPGAD